MVLLVNLLLSIIILMYNITAFWKIIFVGAFVLISACVTNDKQKNVEQVNDLNDNEKMVNVEDKSVTAPNTLSDCANGLKAGRWRAFLTFNETQKIPFNFDVVNNNNNNCEIVIINGDERISVNEITQNGKEIAIKLPFYNSEIKGQFNEKRIFGNWHNYAKGPDYKIAFYAAYGDSSRFYTGVVDDLPDVNGKWEVVFMSDDKKSKTDAIAEFKQNGTHVTGTFLTPTGDYRFLEGNVSEKELMLSCFDGAHAFLFIGQIKPSGDIMGDFWSGSHFHEIWLAFKADEPQPLPDPNAITNLINKKLPINFAYPNMKGEMVSLKDKKYQDKVVMLQIMGSWCPNCKDETTLYTQWYNKYHSKGLEIIALAFENSDNLETTKPILIRYCKQLGVNYEMLLAGKASKKAASEAFPMLNKITSFPTTIFIDKQGNIRQTHTGFNGPATSEYQDFVQQTEMFIEALLDENS